MLRALTDYTHEVKFYQMTGSDFQKKARLHVIDIIKVVYFFFIVTYECFNVLFDGQTVWPFHRYYILDFIYPFVSVFSYSGFIILIVFAFMAGFKNNQIQLKKLLVLLTLSILFLSLTEGGFHFYSMYKEWDIYHFIFVFVGLLYLLSLSQVSEFVIFIFGCLFFIFSWKDFGFFSDMSLVTRRIFVEVCADDGRGGWFLLPWIGLPFIFYAMGKYVQKNPDVYKIEAFIFFILLVASFKYWDGFSNPPMSLTFHCYVFSRPQIVFWSVIFPVIWLLRYSNSGAVKNLFSKYKWLTVFSSLSISKRFGVAFLFHFIYLYLGSELSQIILYNQHTVALYMLSGLPIIELSLKVYNFLEKKLIGIVIAPKAKV
jgi:hypothetical protein